MADDEKDKEQDESVAVAEGEAKEEAGDGPLGVGADDLMDLFSDDDIAIDESLALLTASLSDVDIGDLLEQVRDIQSIIDQIPDR